MKPLLLALLILLAPLSEAETGPSSGTAGVAAPPAPTQAWRHQGVLTLLTTPDGANLPATALIEEFPLLVRLHRDWFDFRQAQPQGEDIRFTTGSGTALAYQIEAWDAAQGTATVWVRMPRITGNAKQDLHMHWGNPAAAAGSDAQSVFNASNGYLSVWHFQEPVRDDAGTLETKDTGTTATPGLMGLARHFDGSHGLFGGDHITAYPSGDSAHTSEAWIRAGQSNGRILAWGNEEAQGKVVMHFKSPPHIQMDCYFSRGNVTGDSRLPLGEWIHVAHTYRDGESRIYVNGQPDGSNTRQGPPLAIKAPAKLWLGGWYHRYDFIGDLDEVRISRVARSADWIRLQYENQKTHQTLVGPLIQPGNAFSLTPEKSTLPEGGRTTIRAEAGGAQKLIWSLIRDGRESILATDRRVVEFAAGRVTGDATATVRLKAVFPGEVKVREAALAIQEAIPDPVFTLPAPATWAGRSTIEVRPTLSNADAMMSAGAGEVKVHWEVAPLAVIQDIRDDTLILRRSQNSGPLRITATLSNGGQPVTQTAIIRVKEPEQDPWVIRTPAPDEKPEEGQFYARDDHNEGTLHYNGTLPSSPGQVVLKLSANDQPYLTETRQTGPDGAYAFAVKLKPGLVRYAVEFGTGERVLHRVGNLVCGDAFLINGQSNAVATDWGKEDPPAFHSEWIRSFGNTSGNPTSGPRWGEATYRSPGGQLQIGYWAMELAKGLVEDRKIPLCLINGAVGGTRIDQHQRNASDPADLGTIYGRLLWRVREARLTHGVRGVIWHQGENDQGADGPTGGYGWENYRRYFIDLAAGWKTDYPNIRHYHLFQIWPKACSMGSGGSDNRLREVQRTLPDAFSHLSIMSTLGVRPPGGCHFPPAGYTGIARLIRPLLERDHYGTVSNTPVTPPNLIRASLDKERKDRITLEFDQPVQWDPALTSEFSLDGRKGLVTGGTVSGTLLTLTLASPTDANTISYLDGDHWNPANVLFGSNGIAALTFCEVPILHP